jgi:acetyl-CoA carboxylase carboxyl transferase subunit beta
MTAADRRCPQCGGVRRPGRAGVCSRCGHHGRLPAPARLALLVDRGSFRERDAGVRAADPLRFHDRLPYPRRLAAARAATGRAEAVLTGTARIGGVPAAVAVFDFGFLAGSMGAAVGERVTRLIEHAAARRLPLVAVTASGGARMQEGIFSLLQMAKVSAALARLAGRGVPYVSVMADPTTGGVAASLGLSGDVNLAEPGALIGFAGPRVAGSARRRGSARGFQRAEFLLRHGMVDAVVPRAELRRTVATLLSLLGGGRSRRPARRRAGHPRRR